MSEPTQDPSADKTPAAGPPAPAEGTGLPPQTPPPPQPPANPWGEAPAGAPQYGAPQYGTPQYGTPQYGTPQYGTPQYGVPGDGAPPPQPGAQPAGQYGAPQYGTPQYGNPRYGPAGWRPAPIQRGVVPLRPLAFLELYDGAFRAVRHNPRVMFGFSAIVLSVMVLLQTVLQWYGFGALGELLSTPLDEQAEFAIGDINSLIGVTLLTTILSTIASTVLTGLLIVSVSRSVIGERLGIAEAWQRARPQLLRLLGLTLLLLLVLGLPWVLWIAGVVAGAVAEQWGVVVVVGLVGGLAALACWVWLAVRTLLATPALMLEETGVVASLRRGWRLSGGSFWRLAGVYALAYVVTSWVASAIVTPVALILPFLGWNPISDPRSLALQALTTLLASLLTVPFVSAVVAMLYIDVRMRREGLDVELTRAAEQAAAETTENRPAASPGVS